VAIPPGRRVAVIDVGSLLSIAALLGAARIGAAPALMNPALTPPELQGLHKNAACADVSVAGERYVDRVREAGAPTVLTPTDLVGHSEPESPTLDPDTADDRDALILFTSGTTGLPKTVGIGQAAAAGGVVAAAGGGPGIGAGRR
jgi:acyl-CoA synthetase (AMP-forming)/AMP-acid ligase II